MRFPLDFVAGLKYYSGRVCHRSGVFLCTQNLKPSVHLVSLVAGTPEGGLAASAFGEQDIEQGARKSKADCSGKSRGRPHPRTRGKENSDFGYRQNPAEESDKEASNQEEETIQVQPPEGRPHRLYRVPCKR